MTATLSAPRIDTRRAIRDGSGPRFLLLVAAIIATSVIVFSWVYTSVPATVAAFRAQVATCMPADGAQSSDVDAYLLQGELAKDCSVGYYRDQAGWVGAGIALQVAVTLGIFLAHPWWITRRRRLQPLANDDTLDLLEDIAGLVWESGLLRAPRWWLDANAETAGGQAFGLPWRPEVVLDAGLVMRYDTDRAGFRAVVRHELAHLHNRDVTRTYVTIAAWWAFVLTALIPFAVLAVDPVLLYPHLHWPAHQQPWLRTVYQSASVAVLAVLVYLTRNAILRGREKHADVIAAAAGDQPALRHVIAGLPPTRWRFGTHPAPSARLAAIDSPGLLLHTSIWEMVAVGFATCIAADNAALLVSTASQDAVLGSVLAVLPAGALAGGLLATAARRNTGTARTWIRQPIALTLGYAAAEPLTLLSASTDGADLSWLNLLVMLPLLFAGAVAVAAWVISVGRSGGRTWPVVAAAVAVAAPLFAVWHVMFSNNMLISSVLRAVAESKASRGYGWYSAVATVTDTAFAPLLYVEKMPFLPFVLLALWATIARRPALGVAVKVGVLVGMCLVAAGALLPMLGLLTFPAAIRQSSAAAAYGVAELDVYLALAAVAGAAAAAFTVARTRAARPPSAVLAVTVTALFGVAGLAACWTVSSCLTEARTATHHCHLAADSYLAGYLQPIQVRGLILAALTVPIVAALRRPSSDTPPSMRAPTRRLSIVLFAISAMVLATTAATARHEAGYWVVDATPTDTCLIGTWTEASYVHTVATPAFGRVRLTAHGATVTFRPDGTDTTVFPDGYVESGPAGSHTWNFAVTGRADEMYLAHNGQVVYARTVSTGTVRFTVDGKTQRTVRLTAVSVPGAYTCSGNQLRISDESDDMVLRRL